MLYNTGPQNLPDFACINLTDKNEAKTNIKTSTFKNEDIYFSIGNQFSTMSGTIFTVIHKLQM
jgi:hypothetical protein